MAYSTSKNPTSLYDSLLLPTQFFSNRKGVSQVIEFPEK